MEYYMILYYVAAFILGTVIGSFLNVCIYRIPKKISVISPPSSCDSCGKRLGFFDLIPVFSYIFLKGRCRYCGARIPVRHLLVEILTGTVFLLLFHRYLLTVEFVMSAYIMSILIIVLFIDADYGIIPDKLVIAGILGSIPFIVYNIFVPVEIYGDSKWWAPFAGIIPGTVFLLIVMIAGFFIYKTDDAMGMGDIKLFVPIGMFLGWRLCIAALLTAVITGGVTSLILIASGIKKRRDTICFAPFIAIGVFAALMWGYEFIEWYFIRMV
jgi:leader peptidase (prepilin peptidase) / N-methyltransferase